LFYLGKPLKLILQFGTSNRRIFGPSSSLRLPYSFALSQPATFAVKLLPPIARTISRALTQAAHGPNLYGHRANRPGSEIKASVSTCVYRLLHRVQYSAMPPKRRRIEPSNSRSITNSNLVETKSDTAVHLGTEDSPTHTGSLSPSSGYKSSPQDADDSNVGVSSASSSRKKSEPVKSACGQCQKRKTKCSGQRPICGFCSDRGLECSWEIGDGLTRNADLRRRLSDANSHAVDINMLVHDMRTNTDAVATTLLAKLRLGDSIQDLATGIRDGTSLVGSEPRNQEDLSPARSPER
jgi:hypothetical protein